MVTSNIGQWQLKKCVAQKKKAGCVSDRYSFIPTSKPLETLIESGWYVRDIVENYIRKADNEGFQKHVVRLRQEKHRGKLSVGDVIAEIVLTNAHNGSAMFQIMCGLYTCICSNQCVTSDSLVASFKIKHVGYTDDLVREAVAVIAKSVPRVFARVKEFKSLELSLNERSAYAKKALNVLYTPDRIKSDFLIDASAKNLLIATRKQEEAPTLWNTYSVVQEKMIRGDRFLVPREKPKSILKTREVKSVDRDITINRNLWELTEKVANKKQGK